MWIETCRLIKLGFRVPCTVMACIVYRVSLLPRSFSLLKPNEVMQAGQSEKPTEDSAGERIKKTAPENHTRVISIFSSYGGLLGVMLSSAACLRPVLPLLAIFGDACLFVTK